MQGLQRVHPHAGDVLPAEPHAQGALAHIVECEGVAFVDWVTYSRLHFTPPAVIGAAEAHQVAALGVVTSQPDRLHYRFGSGHVERHFIHSRDRAQAVNVVCHHWVVSAEHRSQVAHTRTATLDTFFIEVVAEDIHPIRTGQVIALVAVHVSGGGAVG